MAAQQRSTGGFSGDAAKLKDYARLLDVILFERSTNPNAPGIAELVRGTASFGDIITRDQYSPVHLMANGDVGNDPAVLAVSPMLATVIEAQRHSYDQVVIDAGSAADIAVERLRL